MIPSEQVYFDNAHLSHIVEYYEYKRSLRARRDYGRRSAFMFWRARRAQRYGRARQLRAAFPFLPLSSHSRSFAH